MGIYEGIRSQFVSLRSYECVLRIADIYKIFTNVGWVDSILESVRHAGRLFGWLKGCERIRGHGGQQIEQVEKLKEDVREERILFYQVCTLVMISD